jgi:hypothetical protein
MGTLSVGDVVIIPFPYGVAGHLKSAKIAEAIAYLIEMLSACVQDDSF